MSIEEILEQLPNLTIDEKRQLWSVLGQELAATQTEEEGPEFLAKLDARLRTADAGGHRHTIEEAREVVGNIAEKQSRR